MRKFQNIVSTLGNVIVRQGNALIVRVEASRSLCAFSDALRSFASILASWLSIDAWQGLYLAGSKPRVGTPSCFAMTPVVVTQHQRRHEIMCHRAAA